MASSDIHCVVGRFVTHLKRHNTRVGDAGEVGNVAVPGGEIVL